MYNHIISSYPLFITVESILNLSFAIIVFLECAGIIIASPVFKIVVLSSIIISAWPSIICINVSKGEVLTPNASPVSKETALTFPVVFFMIVFINTEFGTYSIISTTINVLAFYTSGFSIL